MKDVNILKDNGVNVDQSLELFGDMDMYNETLKDFLSMIDGKLSSLEQKKNLSDMANYAIEVHALKSDARYLGFTVLADMAYDSELKSKAGDVMYVQENHPKIMEETKRVVEIAKKYMGMDTPQVSAQTQTPMPQATPADQANQMNQMNQMAQAQNPMGQPMNQMAQGYDPNMQSGMMNPYYMQQPYYGNMMYPGYYQMPQGYDPNMQSGMQQPYYGNMMYPGYYQMPQTGMMYPGYYQMPQTGMPQQAVDLNQPQQFSGDPMAQAIQTQMPSMPTNTESQPETNEPKDGIILIVDDSNLVVNFVKKIFESKYNVMVANDGAQAIEIVDQEDIRKDIKACLLDLNMPNVDGFQVLEHFKQKGYFVKMPVAVESGVEDMQSIDKVNSYPIVDILSKPFNERDIQRVIEKCLATYF